MPLDSLRSDCGAQTMYYRVSGRPGPLDRPALPAGHALTWGLLTDGTVLDGAEYPFPVFNDLPR